MEDELFSERYLISLCRRSIYISRVVRFLFDRLIERKKKRRKLGEERKRCSPKNQTLVSAGQDEYKSRPYTRTKEFYKRELD